MDNKYLLRALDVASYALIVATVFVMPLIGDKSLVNSFIIPKQYVFIGMMLLGILFWGVKTVLAKKISYSRSILDFPILATLGVGLLSSALSSNFYYSFLGRGEYFVINFLFLLFLGILYFLAISVVNTPARWEGVCDALILSGGITGLLFFVQTVFGLDIIKYWIGSAWNTVSQLNQAFGLWMVFIFVLSAGQLIKKELTTGRSLFYFLITILSFTVLALLGFSNLWWVLLVGIVLLLLVGATFITHARLGWLSVLFTFLVLSVVFITFGSPKAIQRSLPPEVSLGMGPSWSISIGTLVSGVKNFAIGSGIGTFGIDFSQFRPANFNYDQIAWSLRFGQPYSTIMAILSEGGVLLTVAILFLFFFLLGHVMHSWFKVRAEGNVKTVLDEVGRKKMNLKINIFLVAISWLLVSISMIFSFWEPVMWWLWWILLALVVSGLSFINSNIITDKEWKVEETPQYSLSFSFVTIVVMMAVVMAGVWGVKIYLAEKAYANALRAGDLSKAEEQLNVAISNRPYDDSYYAGLAQVYLLKAASLSQTANPDMQQVSVLVANAVNVAKKATDLSPRSVALWENMATMYENATVIIPQAKDWTVKAWTQAVELEPTNPVLYYRLANNYFNSDNAEKAEENYKKAIDLKSDYAAAYVGLANIYEKAGKTKEAVATYEKVLSTGIMDVDVYFNYGRLLYNRNSGDDRKNAENIWLKIIQSNPKHSNTLYSLGLLYEAQGSKTKALDYYYKVRELNPDNKDIINKIRSLVGDISSDNTNSAQQ